MEKSDVRHPSSLSSRLSIMVVDWCGSWAPRRSCAPVLPFKDVWRVYATDTAISTHL